MCLRKRWDFPVSCLLHPSRTEKLSVYYFFSDGKWYPTPPMVCDSSPNDPLCAQCVASVIQRAEERLPFSPHISE